MIRKFVVATQLVAPILISAVKLYGSCQRRMDVYKHTAVSFAVSALLLITLKKIQMSLACFLTSILMDFDHIFDYCMNQELIDKLEYLRHPRRLFRFLLTDYNKTKPSDKVYKPLHSVELLIPISLLYAFGIWNEVATGILIGFVIHLIMDIMPLGYIRSVSMIYKINRGFPRGADIVKQRLSRIGRDVDRCRLCGAHGETVLYKRQHWYTGFTRRGLDKITIICPDCHDQIDNEKY